MLVPYEGRRENGIDEKDNGGMDQRFMSTLSPRTHHRSLKLSQRQPHHRPSSTTAMTPYHPSSTARPGTSPLTQSYPHPHPFKPSNRSEARSIFTGKQYGPFLSSSSPYTSPLDSLQFRPNTLGGSMTMRVSSHRSAAELTQRDCYLNSPDENVKRFEQIWRRQHGEENKKKFIQQTQILQAEERRKGQGKQKKERE